MVHNCPIIIRNVLYEYLLSNYPIIFSSQWFMSTICEGCQHVYGFDESLVFPQTPFCHQSFPILSSGLTSLPSPSCNHHNPIADTMLARLGNNCDNRRSVNIYYLSFISSWRWRGDAGCRRCRHWQVKRHWQSWTTALLGPSCEYTDYWYSNIHYTVLTHHGVNIQFVQDTASKYYWQSYWRSHSKVNWHQLILRSGTK